MNSNHTIAAPAVSNTPGLRKMVSRWFDLCFVLADKVMESRVRPGAGVLFKRTILAVSVLGFSLSARAQTGTIQDVQHVVILMQENRSFDHYFGSLQGVCGFNDRNALMFSNGSSVFYQPTTATNYILPFHTTNSCINDVEHDEYTGLEAWDGGWWNDWIDAKRPEVMAYYTRSDLQFYYALADNYTICDQNFCSFIGPTFPNRLFLFTGMIDPNGTGGGPVIQNRVPTNGFTWTTYPERLQTAGVSWKVYRPNGDWFGDALQWFSNYMNAQPGDPLYDRGMASVNDVVGALAADVTNGTLPSVSWIIPTGDQSEHPPSPSINGELFVKQIMGALALDTNILNSTVFIITYDENGGFYDHVPAPIPPIGTTNEYVNGQPTGLGIRVPMFIISPWTRGGKVCSQIFDHTSIIRFLETWTGVQEPNISSWRRQVCGDLTSAFDFAHPDTSRPMLPKVSGMWFPPVTPSPPSPQILPVQEPGTKTACPLPYQPNANSYTDCGSEQVYINMDNSGPALVHFSIYPNIGQFGNPRQYDVAPSSSINDSFSIGVGGIYDFTCYGPNGFQRRIAGNITNDCGQIEVTSTIDTNASSITLALQNSTASNITFNVNDGYATNAPAAFTVPPGTIGTNSFIATNGWYDLTVTADGDTNFLRRLTGHIETGAFTTTSPSLPFASSSIFISTNSSGTTGLITVTNPPPYTINDKVNDLIAGFPTNEPPDTNALMLTVACVGGNLALVYQGWASNCVIETSANFNSGSWAALSCMPTNINNYNVVFLPATNPGAFFRLRN